MNFCDLPDNSYLCGPAHVQKKSVHNFNYLKHQRMTMHTHARRVHTYNAALASFSFCTPCLLAMSPPLSALPSSLSNRLVHLVESMLGASLVCGIFQQPYYNHHFVSCICTMRIIGIYRVLWEGKQEPEKKCVISGPAL